MFAGFLPAYQGEPSSPKPATRLDLATLLWASLATFTAVIAPARADLPIEESRLLAAVTERLDAIESASGDLSESEADHRQRRRFRGTLRQLQRHLEHIESPSAASLRQSLALLDRFLATGREPRLFPPPDEHDFKGFGGGIAGRVTDAATGEPVAFASVVVLNSVPGPGASVRTGPDGYYLTGTLLPGAYYVYFLAEDTYVDELFDDHPCPDLFIGNDCNQEDGTVVMVSSESVTAGVDAQLDVGGVIEGMVTITESGDPLGSSPVDVWNSDGSHVKRCFTDSSGVFRCNGLDAGTYYVTSRDGGSLREELYNDIPCTGGPFVGCDPTTGTPISVALGATTSGIDFAHEELGQIQGRVFDGATGTPIPIDQVEVFDHKGAQVNYALTGADGQYDIYGLDPGIYYVATELFADYANELYDDIPCLQGAPFDCDPTSGTPIPVDLAARTDGIDFALRSLGRVRGVVTHTDTSNPIPLLDLWVYTSTGYRLARRQTDLAGRYEFRGLLPGAVFVLTDNSIGYLDELFDNLPCTDDDEFAIGCDPTLGTPIPTALDTVTDGIDFSLDFGGTIEGRVIHAFTNGPISRAVVRVYDQSGTNVRSSQTDVFGNYRIGGLHSGTYHALAEFSGLLPVLYDGIVCTSCLPTSGTPIAIALNEATTGIDFSLPPVPLFTDGFESADTSAWSDVVPGNR